MRTKIFIRADEHNPAHIQNTINFSRILHQAFDTTFIISYENNDLQTRLEWTGNKAIQLPREMGLIEEAYFIAEAYLDEASITVLHGQQFRSVYQEVIKSTRCKLVCIDDNFQTHYRADVVLNDLAFNEYSYATLAATKQSLGLDYLLLDKCFSAAKAQINQQLSNAKEEDSVLVCLEAKSNNFLLLGVGK